ncbi:MAG: dolichyl-phosphate-mannose-protein mannosyltransferase, partial [uncultured bacterium]
MKEKIYNNKMLSIIFLIAITLLIRLYCISNPIYDMQYWRQADTASMAKNFYEEGMNIFYPTVNWRGDTKGYVESEFPLYQYTVALIYKIFNKTNDIIGRLLSVFFAIISVLYLYKFTLIIFDYKTAFLSALFYSIAPLSVYYTRTFMPESMMMCFVIMVLYYFYLWVQNDKYSDWLLAIVFGSLAILLKLTSVVFLGVMFLMLIQKHGKDFIQRKNALLFLGLVSILPTLWYIHAYNLYLETNLSFGVIAKCGFSKFSDLNLLLSPEFWMQNIDRLFGTVLSPIGGTLFVLSFLLSCFNKEILNKNIFLNGWVVIYIIFVLTVGNGVKILEYYNIIIVPVVGIYIARFLIIVANLLFLKKSQVTGLFLGIIYIGIFISGFSHIYGYYNPREFRRLSIDFAGDVNSYSTSKDLFIVVDIWGEYDNTWYDSMNNRIHSPCMLYYLNRKGWEILPHEFLALPVSGFDDLVKNGAKYLLIPKAL